MDDCSVSKYYVLWCVNINNCFRLPEEQLTLRFAIWVYEIYVLLI